MIISGETFGTRPSHTAIWERSAYIDRKSPSSIRSLNISKIVPKCSERKNARYGPGILNFAKSSYAKAFLVFCELTYQNESRAKETEPTAAFKDAENGIPEDRESSSETFRATSAYMKSFIAAGVMPLGMKCSSIISRVNPQT